MHGHAENENVLLLNSVSVCPAIKSNDSKDGAVMYCGKKTSCKPAKADSEGRGTLNTEYRPTKYLCSLICLEERVMDADVDKHTYVQCFNGCRCTQTCSTHAD